MSGALECSFCGKQESQVERLVTGASASICNECLALCRDVLEDGGALADSPPAWTPSPDEQEELHRIGKELRQIEASAGWTKSRTSNMACAFCGKLEDDVAKLIAGPTAFICDECVRRYEPS